MYGAVIGDIVGSRFEGRGKDHKSKDFQFWHEHCRFTDDMVCVAAAADILMNDRDPAPTLQSWCREYHGRGYGGWFRRWMDSAHPRPYNSFGNGAGMKVSPAAYLNRGDLDAALAGTVRITEITHDHPEGIKGAKAVAHAVWLALNDRSADDIRAVIAEEYGYHMDRTVERDTAGLQLRRDLHGLGPGIDHLRAGVRQLRGRGAQRNIPDSSSCAGLGV